MKDIRVGDFLVVRLRSRVVAKCFLGQVTEAADHVEVSFLREIGENKHVFPTTEDRSTVDAADVVGKVIKVTPDRRGSCWTVPFQLNEII